MRFSVLSLWSEDPKLPCEPVAQRPGEGCGRGLESPKPGEMAGMVGRRPCPDRVSLELSAPSHGTNRGSGSPWSPGRACRARGMLCGSCLLVRSWGDSHPQLQIPLLRSAPRS